MVAVISGTGLGLFGSSVSALGGAGAFGNAAPGRGGDRLFVNTATGNLIVQSQDEVLSALGLDLALVRTYNSQGLLDDDNGDNWRLGVHQRVYGLTGAVNTAGSTITKVFGDGREVVYSYNASQSRYVSTDGSAAHDTLSYNTGTSQWTWTDGSARNTETYNSSGQLIQARDADGNLVTYTYTGALLTQIADASGQTTFLDYTGNNLQKIRVVSNGQTQTLTSYTYDASNRLTQVTVDLSPQDNSITDNQVYTTTYAYEDTSRRILSITQKDGSQVSFTYTQIDGAYRVRTYTDALGRVTTLTYSQATGGGSTVNAPANTGVLSTTDTQTTTNTYNVNSGALSTTDTQTTTNSYNLNTGALTAGGGGGAWAAAALLDTGGVSPQLGFDTNGNGVAVWTKTGVLYWSRYTKSTNSWSATTSIGTLLNFSTAKVAVSATGDVAVAWLRNSGGLYVNRFNASAGTWSMDQVSASTAILNNWGNELSVSINGSYAAVSWLEMEGGGPDDNFVRIARWNGSSWSALGGQDAGAGTGYAVATSVSIDAQGNVAVAWQQGTDNISFARTYTSSTATWGSAAQLATLFDGAMQPSVLLATNGNGVVAWRRDNQMLVRTFWRTTNSWSAAPTEIDSRTNTISSSTLALDQSTGDAVAAWVQSDGTAASLYASRYSGSTNTWSAAQLLESSSSVVWDEVTTQIRNGNAIVAWTQGSSSDLYAARYSSGAWSAPASLETSANASSMPAAAIDAQGNAAVFWSQSGGLQQARYAAGGQPYYLVPAGATWQSVANTLYGVNSAAAGTALQTALGNPALTAGAQLTNLPATLSVTTTTTITVPPYYTIPSGATWQSVANTLYGVNSAAAGSALQTALSNPPLTAGNRLTNLPATLSVTTTTTITVPAYYTVQAGNTWSSITQTIYGTSTANAVAALQAATGNPTLTTGLHLTVPLTLTYSSGTGGTTLYQHTDVRNEALGLVAAYEHDAAGRLRRSLSPTIGGSPLEVSYTYDADGNVATVTEDPAGLNRVTTYAYDPNGNLLSSRDSLGNTVSRTYNANNQLLTETQYLVPDPDAGGTGQPSSPLTARYVYDSESHLRFSISAQGRVTEHQYNAAGQRILTRKFTGALYTGTNFAESDLQTWAAAQTLTLLERSDYAYDFRGNLTSITAWATTTSAGAGSGTSSVTKFVYDQRGQLLQTLEARGSAGTPNPATPNLAYATTYVYDGLGRVLSTTQWNSSTSLTTTLNSYDDVNRRTATTLANGLVTTRTYNRANELITVQNGTASVVASLGTTTYAYDVGGRLRIVTDPTGVRQFTMYDDAGRRSAVVDGDGTLTEFIYDRASKLIKTVQYAARIDSTTLASLVDASGNPTTVTLATLRTAAGGNAAQDWITRNVWDNAGRLVYTIDEIGAVTQFFYDGAGRVTDQLRYATPVTIARTVDQVLPGSFTVTTHADDRRARNFYDAEGRLLGTLDGERYLTEYKYDAAGHLIEQIGYANQVTSASWQTDPLNTLRPAFDEETGTDPERDSHHYCFYDGQGRKIGALDAEGYLTETVYDVAGNVSQTVRYDRVLPFTVGTSTFQTLKTAANGAATHTTSYQYDGAGRLKEETNYEGTITRYDYDDLGRLIVTTRAATTTEVRTTQTRYDLLGRVLQELTAEGSAAIAAITNPTQTQINDIWNRYGITYVYDTSGRRISATVRPNDTQTNTTLYFYDEDGRLRFEVNALGERKEYRYNALGQLTDELGYTNRISTTGLNGGLLNATLIATLTGSTSSQDAQTTYTYKLTGALATKRIVRTSSSAEDTVAAYSYNSFGERVQQADSGDSAVIALTYDRRGLATQTRWDQTGLNITEDRVYDAFGRLKQITDGRLNVIKRFEYDRLGREIAHTESATSDRTVTSYDAFSRVLTVRDALLNTTTYSYNDANRSMTLTTPESVVVTTTFNRHGQKLTVVAAGNTTTYAYDLNGNLTSVSDSLSAGDGRPLETRTYDRGGRELTRIDARGTTISFVYDAVNRVLQRIEDSGAGGLALLTQYTYDGQGRVTRVDEPNGRRTDTTYYRDGRIDTVAVDPTGFNLRTRYTYDRSGRVITVTEGYGSTAPSKPRITQYIYDKMGRRTEEVVDPTASGGTLNLRTQYRYDKSGNLTRKIDARGYSSWYVYDADNRVTHTIDALGGVTQTTYDAEDQVSATRRYAASIPSATVAAFSDSVTTANFSISTGSLDRVSRSFFDRDGREKYTIDAAGAVTQRLFDANGQVTRTRVLISPALTGTYADAAAVTTALGSAATTINVNDRIAWTAYDLRGRAAYSVDGLGKVTRYKYDANGNVVSKTEFATARLTTLAMDFSALDTAYGSLAASGDDRYTRHWYDATNRLRFTLDPEGYLTEQQYNDAGRLETTIRYAAKPTVPSAATLAHLAARSNGVVIPTDVNVDQKTISAYDAAGRLSRVTDALGNYEEYTYDAVGNKLTYRNQKGSVWDYQYDANGRLTKEIAPLVAVTSATETATAVTVAASTNVRLETVMVYDALGNVTSRTEAANTSNARQTTYEYDALGRQTITRFPPVNVYSTSGDTQLGNGAAIARTESSQALYSEVAYDALGNVFRNRDVAGIYSFKIYDVLGRVEYEIDPERYVTQYTYDVFGNKTTTKRYEKPLTAALPNNTTSLTSSALSGILVAGADRTVTTTYNRLNKATQVTQLAVSNFSPNNGSSGGATFSAGSQTLTDYNAFGEATRTRRLIDPASGGIYADTYFYYDRRGLKTAQVDPLKYLTIFEYDETGDLKRQLEYAAALTSTVNFSGYGTPTVTTSTTAPTSAVGWDRETLYAYDRLNRKVSETRVGIEHSIVNGTTVTAANGNQVTTYGYDALGNQTRVTQVGVLVNGTATDLHSYTYFDVLGRVVAKVEPARNLGNGTILTPLTVMRLDAYGNVLEQTEYANGANGTPTEAAVATALLVDSTKDRTTRMAVDSHGRVIHSEDAKGADRLASYNARGELVKEWQAVTNADTVVEYRTTLYTYDNLGRQIDVTEPQRYVGATTVSVTNRAKYNSFGEVIERGLVDGTASSGKQEFFHYDLAGRLWRTNSGDGVIKVYLHDLAGNVTAEIRSQSLNLADNTAYANAATVGGLTSNVLRTETRYDVQGRVVEQRLPTFNTTSGLEAITATFTIGPVSGPKNPEAVYQRVTTPAGVFYVVNPTATVAQQGGYYLSASGQYVQDTSQTIITATRVTWDAPTDASVEAKFEYRVLGSSDPNAWAVVPVGILSSNRLSANVSSLMNQTYEYRVSYRRRTETTAYAQASGSFRVDGTISGGVAISQNPQDPASEVAALAITQTDGMVAWAAPSDTTVVATLRVRPTGTSSYTDLTALRVSGNFSVNARDALSLAGTYDYEIVYTRNGATIAKKAGTLTSTGTTNPRIVTVGSPSDLTGNLSVDAVAAPTGQVSGEVGAAIASTETFDFGTKPGHVPAQASTWTGGNIVNLTWANIGAGQVRVEIDYLSQSWKHWQWNPVDVTYEPVVDPAQTITNRQFTFASGATGAQLTWATASASSPGGIAQIYAVRVYKETSPGVWTPQFSQSNPTPSYGRGVNWAAPTDPNLQIAFEYAPPGSGAWTALSVNRSLATCGVELNAVVQGNYDYRITYRLGNRITARQTGTLAIVNQSTTTTTTVTVTPNSAPAAPATVASVIGQSGTTLSASITGSSTRTSSNQNHTVFWNGTNSVSATWTDLGNVPVRVFVDYVTKDSFDWVFNPVDQAWEHDPIAGEPRTRDVGVFTNASTGKALSWSESGVNPGGIASVTNVRVYTQDGSGNYTVLARSLTGSTPPTLAWTAPPAGVTPTFGYRVSGSGSAYTWITPQTVSSQLHINLTGLASAAYEYYIGYRRSGESFDASGATGTFALSGTVVTVSSQTAFNNAPTWLSGVTGSGSTVTWTRAATGGDSVTFEYWNGSSWVARSASVSGSTYTVNMAGVGAGTYSYRVRYTHSGQSLPYVEGTGTVVVGVTTTTTPASVTPTVQSSQTFPAALIGPVTRSGQTFSWSYAKQNASDTVQVQFTAGAGYNVTQTLSGSGPAYSFTIPPDLPAGSYSSGIFVDYFRAGETDSYARVDLVASVAVTYPTVYATVTFNSQNAVYPSGMQQIAAPTDLGSNYLGWTTSAVAGATVTFRYQAAAGGAWTELNEEVNGSGFKVNVQSISGGLFNYEVLYTRAGETNPYAGASGTLNVTRNTTVTGSSITPTSSSGPTPVAVTPTQRQTVDRWGNVVALTDASSNTTNYRYNQYGQLIETRQPQVAFKSTTNGQVTTGNGTPTTRNYYDRASRLIAVQDANGNLTRATLNAAGQVLTESHTDGGTKGSTYDAFGQLVTVVDELLFETRNIYDRVGNLTAVAREVTDNVFITDNYAYDEAGRRISETNAENEITRYYYDLHDNLLRRRTHLNANTTYGYDAGDRKILEQDAISGQMTWAYDYFGRMTGHIDLGGVSYTYSYAGNYAGLLQSQTQTGQTISYVYDAAAHLTQINDAALGRNVTYSYDAAGRRSREKTKINGLTYQDTFIQYDVLNRMQRMTDLRYDTTYSYDLQGNRTNIVANYYDHERRLQTQDLWYTYDSMNRVLVSQGANTFNQIDINTKQGVRLTYNAAGQRTSSTTYGKLKFRHEHTNIWNGSDLPTVDRDLMTNAFTGERYEYDGLGRLTKTWRDGEEWVLRTNSSGQVVQDMTTQTSVLISNREYDGASRETKETSKSIENEELITRDRTSVYNDDGQLDTQTTRREDPGVSWQTESIVDYNYDAANVLRSYTVDVYKTGPLNPGIQYRSTYNNFYRSGESYQDAGQSVSSQALAGGVQVPQAGSTTRSYNINGELISFTDTKGADKSRYFANGVGGQPLLVVQGNISNVAQAFADALARADNSQKSQHFFFANGQAVGSFGQLQDGDGKFKANFDVNYTPISDDYPSSVPVSVVAQDNDTLRTIAARVFGDQNLWYLLAEENGRTDPDELIEEGTIIQVPNEVISVSNSSSSFKPFNIADAIGDTSPTQPAPPRPKKKGCGVIGQILMVVVAIVVTWFTAGATSGFFAGALGSTGGAIATAATAAAAGSIASQGVGIAIGAQDSFSWKSVATAALTAGITAGVGLGNFDLIKGTGSGVDFVNAAARGLASNAISQGVNIAVGLQERFSWRDLAISAVSAPIAEKVGDKVGAHFEGRTSSAFAASVGSSITSAVVRVAFGGRVDAQTVLADVFGNAIGNSIVEANTPIGITREQWDDVDGQLTAERVAISNEGVAAALAADNLLTVNPANASSTLANGAANQAPELPMIGAITVAAAPWSFAEEMEYLRLRAPLSWMRPDGYSGGGMQIASEDTVTRLAQEHVKHDIRLDYGSFAGMQARADDLRLMRLFTPANQLALGEGILTTVSGGVGMVLNGWATMAFRDPGFGAYVQESVTYSPRFQITKDAFGAIAPLTEGLEHGRTALADAGYSATGSPLVGATLTALPDAVSFALIPEARAASWSVAKDVGVTTVQGAKLFGEAASEWFYSGMERTLEATGQRMYVVPKTSGPASTPVWSRNPLERGNTIELDLAATEYSEANGWYHIGAANNGYFPLVDFQQSNTLVSLKTVDTRGSSWMSRTQDHIGDLGRGGATVNGAPANMVLDMRVQPGGASAASSLVQYGQRTGVTVIIKEYP